MTIKCFKCTLSFDSVDKYSSHLTLYHKKTELFECSYINCFRKYNIKKSYLKHIKDHFTNYSDKNKVKCKTLITENNQSLNVIVNENSDNTFEDFTTNFINYDLSVENPKNIDLKNDLWKLCLKLYSDSKVPKSTTVQISKVIYKTIESIVSKIDSLNLSYHEILGMSVSELSFLKSEYLFTKEILNSSSFVSASTILIHKENETQTLTDGNILIKSMDYSIEMLHLHVLFSYLLNNFEYLDLIVKYMNESMNFKFLRSFLQSNFWKNKIPKNEETTLFLPLLIYGDDFEPNNCIGSHAGFHKIGGFYCKFLCLPEEISSKLSNIFLICLYFSDDRKKFGNDRIFTEVVNELNVLRNIGIDLKVNKFGYTKVKFVTILFCGDNLALNEYFEICQNFNSNFFCRFCTLDKTQCHDFLYESYEKLRTVDYLYNYPELGVKKDSIFNKIEDFHIFQNPSADRLHDLAEGICKYDFLFILKNIIPSFLTISDLNFRLINFKYPLNFVENKPPLFNTDFDFKRLRFSGEECKIFTFIFGLLIGDLIPLNDPIWELYISLREIMTYVYTNNRKNLQSSDFASAIANHHAIYKRLSGLHLPAKFHLLTHYPSIFDEIGLLKFTDTSRFESFHGPLKRTAVNSQNRINLLKTIVTKYQFKLVENLLDFEHIENFFKISSGILKESSEDNLLIYNSPCDKYSSIMETNYLIYSNIKFSTSCVINVENLDSLNYTFAIIEKIFKINCEYFLGLTELKIINFNKHYYAYKIEITNNKYLRKFSDIEDKKCSVINRIGDTNLLNWL